MQGVFGGGEPMNVWETLLNDDLRGFLLKNALQTLMIIPADVIEDAINRIEHAESVGPYVDPTAWLDGKKFRNAKDYKAVLIAVLTLRRLLPDNTTGNP